VPAERRTARFVCAAAAVLPDGRELLVEEALEGTIVGERRGTNGFGYDPVFVPLGSTQTTAELSSADKDAISHRGKAFRALAPLLVEALQS
jgi:XTP/dITP diphosphohydrolase